MTVPPNSLFSDNGTDGSGIRYRKDFACDANDNLKRVDVENRGENGVLNSNAGFTTTFDYEILNKLIRRTEEVDASRFILIRGICEICGSNCAFQDHGPDA